AKALARYDRLVRPCGRALPGIAHANLPSAAGQLAVEPRARNRTARDRLTALRKGGARCLTHDARRSVRWPTRDREVRLRVVIESRPAAPQRSVAPHLR